jgi:hypothetical protein
MDPNEIYNIKWRQVYATSLTRPFMRTQAEITEQRIEKELQKEDFTQAMKVINQIKLKLKD